MWLYAGTSEYGAVPPRVIKGVTIRLLRTISRKPLPSLIMQFQENADGELERAFRVPRTRWHENADGELEPPRQETRSLLHSSLDEDRMVKED